MSKQQSSRLSFLFFLQLMDPFQLNTLLKHKLRSWDLEKIENQNFDVMLCLSPFLAHCVICRPASFLYHVTVQVAYQSETCITSTVTGLQLICPFRRGTCARGSDSFHRMLGKKSLEPTDTHHVPALIARGSPLNLESVLSSFRCFVTLLFITGIIFSSCLIW